MGYAGPGLHVLLDGRNLRLPREQSVARLTDAEHRCGDCGIIVLQPAIWRNFVVGVQFQAARTNDGLQKSRCRLQGGRRAGLKNLRAARANSPSQPGGITWDFRELAKSDAGAPGSRLVRAKSSSGAGRKLASPGHT